MEINEMKALRVGDKILVLDADFPKKGGYIFYIASKDVTDGSCQLREESPTNPFASRVLTIDRKGNVLELAGYDLGAPVFRLANDRYPFAGMRVQDSPQ